MIASVNLPFSSQQQLLARLLHLSRLDTDFILLTGPKGAGKSYLAQRLVAQTSLARPVLLDAQALDSHSRFRDALLSHWFPDAIFDAQQPLAESMSRLLATHLHKRLVVVDNGEWLTDVLLHELAQLHLILPAAVRPFMVLVGNEEWANQVRTQLDEIKPAKILEIEVPALTSSDQQTLWQALNYQPPSGASAEIRYPGEALDIMEPKMNTQDYRQLLEQKSVKILLTVFIIVLVLIVAVSLLGGANNSSEVAQALDQGQEQSRLPAPLPNGGKDANSSSLSSNTPGQQQVQDWPAEPLPETPTITSQDTNSVEDEGDKERVIIEDDVVSQLMQRKPELVEQPAAAAPPPAKPQPATAKPQPAPAKPAPATSAAPKPSPQPKATASTSIGSVSSLMQKSPARYTLQLMAGRNKKVLEALAAKHKLTNAWIYPRTINGQAWFVLVQGDYTNADQARAAVNQLPAELKAAKPWPKSFAQAQKEAKS